MKPGKFLILLISMVLILSCSTKRNLRNPCEKQACIHGNDESCPQANDTLEEYVWRIEKISQKFVKYTPNPLMPACMIIWANLHNGEFGTINDVIFVDVPMIGQETSMSVDFTSDQYVITSGFRDLFKKYDDGEHVYTDCNTYPDGYMDKPDLKTTMSIEENGFVPYRVFFKGYKLYTWFEGSDEYYLNCYSIDKDRLSLDYESSGWEFDGSLNFIEDRMILTIEMDHGLQHWNAELTFRKDTAFGPGYGKTSDTGTVDIEEAIKKHLQYSGSLKDVSFIYPEPGVYLPRFSDESKKSYSKGWIDFLQAIIINSYQLFH